MMKECSEKEYKRRFPDITESVELLERLVKKEVNMQRKVRLKLLYLIKTDRVKSQKAAADELSVHRNSIGNWLQAYRSGGFKDMLFIGAAGGPPEQRSLPEAVYNELEERLKDPEGFISYQEIHEWVTTERHVDIKYGTLYDIVRHKLCAKLKSAKKSHIKKDR